MDTLKEILLILWDIVQQWWLIVLISTVSAFVIWKAFWFFFIKWYIDKAAKKRVYMQIMMPREESQKDKEQATEKDFREKIATMDQLIRGLHEIRELNFMNKLKVWLFQFDTVSFEIHAKYKEVTFFASIDPYYSEILEKSITSTYPNASIEYVKPPSLQPEDKEKPNFIKAYYLYLKRTNWYPLRTYKEIESDPLNDLTNVLSKLEGDERALIQFMIRPRNPKWQKEARDFATALFKGQKPKSGFRIPILSWIGWVFIALFQGVEAADKNAPPPGASSGDSYVRMLQTEEELAKRIGEKADSVGFDTVIRVFASTDKGEAHADTILNGLFVAFNVTKDAASNWFQSRRILGIDWWNSKRMYNNYKQAYFQWGEKSSLLTPQEIASIYHFPTTRYNFTPVIKWLSYKVLPAPNDMDPAGILLGYNVFRGEKKEVRFGKRDRSRHHYIIGQTGTGKSAYISYLARQDIQNGDGVCVVDPHGDLIEDILQYIPKERAKDVIVFSPADMERPMGLNMLEAATTEQQDMASSQATEIFIKIFGDEIFGPRIQHYFRNACLTLMEDPDEGATLIDVPRIFVDEEFMRYKVAKVKNPVVRSFWEHEYANTGDRERQEMIPYFSSKFGPFITNAIMRNTIGQPKSAFDFRQVMDSQKILLINLSKGKLGTLNTQLLGLVVVAKIQMAAMSRVDTPEDERKDFFLYVDEFQNFATDTFCSILSEARKYRLNLIMAHQYINQLVVSKFGSSSTQIRDAVFGNVGTLQSFKIGADDAEMLAKEYAPVLTEQDVIGIDNYKAYMKLYVKGKTSRPFSLETIWDTTGASAEVRDIVKQYSRMKYGRKRIFVDQEIAARIGIELDELNKADVDPSYSPEVPVKEPEVEHKPLAPPATSEEEQVQPADQTPPSSTPTQNA
ncbi:type IV secretory system conjugative DNA transfer family protein [Patescibacteria group bacterium]|nr:type IV secretory system conjugative DNA transfer family protein [Patescibacteria group bacterium]